MNDVNDATDRSFIVRSIEPRTRRRRGRRVAAAARHAARRRRQRGYLGTIRTRAPARCETLVASKPSRASRASLDSKPRKVARTPHRIRSAPHRDLCQIKNIPLPRTRPRASTASETGRTRASPPASSSRAHFERVRGSRPPRRNSTASPSRERGRGIPCDESGRDERRRCARPRRRRFAATPPRFRRGVLTFFS